MEKSEPLRWKRHGLIFDVASLDWDLDFIGWAQSPQALVFENFVRVYFSTRAVDETGQYISHVRYVDFSLDFQRVLNHSRHEVVEKAVLGAFDEHGIFPINVIRVGEKIYAYTNGWSRRKSVAVETGVGILISHDQGRTFERLGPGPILSATLNEPFLVGDAFVLSVGDVFHMWYIFGERWVTSDSSLTPERVYKIAGAVSNDGQAWVKLNKRLIVDVLGPDECQALPTVTHFGGKFHMFFSYREAFDFRTNPKNAYRMGYASSIDLDVWKRNDFASGMERAETGWDSQMICYPHLFRIEDKVYLLYNGNEFGRHGFGLAELVSEEGDGYAEY
jgi:hypothetical protein